MKRWSANGIVALLAACSCATLSTAQDARISQEDAGSTESISVASRSYVTTQRSSLNCGARKRTGLRNGIKNAAKMLPALAQATKERADYLEHLVAPEGPNPTPTSKIPQELLGKWIVRKVVATDTVGCLDSKQAQALLGAEIEYRAESFRWKTTNVQSSGSSTNLIGAQEFAQGNSGSGSHVDFNQLGIAASAVEQITINHPDVKIAELSQSGSEAVPGESVLVAGPNTIILEICNTYFEARRE